MVSTTEPVPGFSKEHIGANLTVVDDKCVRIVGRV